MAMNPQNVLSSLRMMSDQQLQQYAAMHKNDPFIFPLAFQESQTRKQMRAESQQAQMAPQPKVADQALASMAAEPMPEEVGIGALPAKNLEGMAAGGIVAFDEGGEVPRFNGTAGSFVGPQYGFDAFLKQLGISPQEFLASSPVDQKNVRDMFSSTQSAAPAAAPATPAAGAAPTQAAARTPTMTERGITAIGNAASTAGDYLKRGLGAFTKYAPAVAVGESLFFTSPEEKAILEKADARRRMANANFDSTTLATAGQGAAPGATAVSPAGKDVFGGAGASGGAGAAPAADTGAQLRPGGGMGIGFKPGEGLGLGTRPGTYMSELESMQPQGEVRSPFESQIRAAGLAETKAAQEYKDLREQQIKDAGLAGVDQERRLKAREEKLAKTEGEVGGLALLKAGLAIMSGSSPYALQNIGSGAQVGVEEYTKGREKIDAARERLDDAFDRLDQVRRGELMMNQKEQAQLQRDVNKTIAQTEKDVLAGAREAYGWKKEDTRAAFNAYVADRRMGAEITSRERLGIADINARLQAAQMNSPLNMYQQLGAAKPDSALRKGFDLTQQARNSGLYGLLGKYADPMELEQLRTTNPEMYAMVVAQMQSALSKGLGASTPPPNAPILPAK
jgi:hypothetical protein